MVVMSVPKVADYMTREVLAVSPDTSLDTASKLMKERRVRGLPVVTRDGQAVGVISTTDLAKPDRPDEGAGAHMFYTVRDGWMTTAIGSPDDTDESLKGKVEDVMTPYVLSVQENDSMIEAARTMADEKVHRLVVVDDDGVLVGILSALDALRGFADTLDPGHE